MSVVVTAAPGPTAKPHSPSDYLRVSIRAKGIRSLPLSDFTRLFGWSITGSIEGAEMRMGNGVVGLLVPSVHARAVALSLEASGCCGPVIEVDTEPRRCVFLADPNEMVGAWGPLPAGTEVLLCPRRIPFPTLGRGSGRARWWVLPDLSRRWLPTLAAVSAAARTVLSLRSDGEGGPRQLTA